MPNMLTIEKAQQKLAAILEKIDETEFIPVQFALGRSLSQPVIAPLDLPPFDSSAMDGYALAGDSVQKFEPFQLVGESLAGHPYPHAIKDHETCRIFTGAAIPEGATMVVIQEDVSRIEDTIVVNESAKRGENIRKQGMDVGKGDTLAHAGDVLSSFAIGWFAACGISHVEVTRKIRIALFSTGDELKDPGEPLNHGEIYESNRMSLSMLMKSKACEIRDLGRLPDNYGQILGSIENVANDVDLIVTSGGVSVGDADFVRPVLEDLGELDFWNIALKPGKPLAVGRVGSTLFFGLPGNPVSTIVTYLLFVAPAIDVLSGSEWKDPTTFRARLVGNIAHKTGRREYQRAIFSRSGTEIRVTPTGDQSSNRLATFYECNCLIVVPANRGNLRDGENVDIVIFPGVRTFV